MDFPQFRIMKREGIVPTIERAKMLPNDFPAKYLEPPDAVIPHARTVLLDDPVLMKSVVPFCIACSVIPLRHVFGIPGGSFWVSGGHVDALTQICKSFGIPVMTLNSEDDLAQIRKHNLTHRWPVLVTCLAEPLRPLIVRLKPEERCDAIFHVADPEKAERLAAGFSLDSFFLFSQHRKPRSSWWEARLPLLNHIFFDRLRHYVQGDSEFNSLQGFLITEKKQWLSKLIEIGGVMSQDQDTAPTVPPGRKKLSPYRTG